MRRTWISSILISLVWAGIAQGQDSNSIGINRSRVKPAPTSADETKKFTAQWRLNLIGTDRKDETSQGKTIETRLDLKSRYNLSENLYLALEPSVRFESGQTQSYDGADKPENKLLMSEASANYFPADYFSVSGGALFQRTSHTTLLMDRLAFPALRVAAGPQAGALKVFAFAESAIPTSTSLSTNTKELEKTPGLDTLGLQFHSQEKGALKISSSLSYFQFRDLPSAVAKDAQLLGNQVTKQSEASYLFDNQFSGLEGFLRFSYLITPRTRLKAEGEYLVNTQVSNDQGQAYQLAGGVDYLLNANIILELNGAFYRVAPEAAVAYFNESGFETNRVGYKTEGFLNFRKLNFRVGLRYNESETIFTSNYQSREKMIGILLETFYVDI